MSHRGAISDGRSETPLISGELPGHMGLSPRRPKPETELGRHRASPPVVLDHEDVCHPLTHVPYDVVSGRALGLAACLVVEKRS